MKSIGFCKNLIKELFHDAENEELIGRDISGSFDLETWKTMSELGLHSLLLPKYFSGEEPISFVNFTELLIILGYYCPDNGLAFAYAINQLAGILPIINFGSKHIKNKFILSSSNISEIYCNAITEPETGSNISTLGTIAYENDQFYNITGTKTYISLAPIADIGIIYAFTNKQKGLIGGLSAFLLNLKYSGAKVSSLEKMGLKTCPMGTIKLIDEKVDKNDILQANGAGFPIFMQTMVWEKIGLSAWQIGIMDRLLERTILYARQRRIGGSNLAEKQVIQMKVAELKTRIEACKAFLTTILYKPVKSRISVTNAAMVKLFVSETLAELSQQVLYLHGGFGYLQSSHLERQVRDAMAGKIYSGTSEMQKEIIFKGLT